MPLLPSVAGNCSIRRNCNSKSLKLIPLRKWLLLRSMPTRGRASSEASRVRSQCVALYRHICRASVLSLPAQPPALAVAWRFQAGRDHHREPGEHSASEEGDPDGAREIRVPCLRDNHPAACAIPSDRPWPRGSKPAGDVQDHVLAAERIHGDDTTVPVLAKGKTITGRLWTYVRDDRPFGGSVPPAAIFYFSRDRRGEHPSRHLARYCGILQADAYAGFGELYREARKPVALTEALCWAHGRRNFFKLAQLAKAPLAIEAVRRIDAIFDLERAINGLPHEQRRATRQDKIGEGDRIHAEALGLFQPVPR
jgi:hypothetical protein